MDVHPTVRDASFDVVVCQMGLQFVADKPAALERDVVEGWQEFVEGRTLTLEVRVVSATARVP